MAAVEAAVVVVVTVGPEEEGKRSNTCNFE